MQQNRIKNSTPSAEIQKRNASLKNIVRLEEFILLISNAAKEKRRKVEKIKRRVREIIMIRIKK